VTVLFWYGTLLWWHHTIHRSSAVVTEKVDARMRVALWLVPGITLASMLVLGSFGFFILLVGLNGVSEAKGGRLLTAYLIVLLAATIFSIWASRWSVQTLTSQSNWSLWVSAPLSIVATVLIAAAIVVVASFILLVFGTT
jgi:hypothetical protein